MKQLKLEKNHNFETVRDRMSVNINHYGLIKSRTAFRLIPISMTLNDIERRNLRFFTEFDSFAGRLRQWLKIDIMVSVNIVYQLQSSTFGHN